MATPVDDLTGAYGFALDEVVDEAIATPAESAAESSCPGCGAALAADAVICISCGYDTRSGKMLRTKRLKHSGAGEAAKTVGKFFIGVILSSVFAVVGLIAWLTIAVMTGWSFGIVAWGIGGLVGLGMRVGYREGTQTAGLVAAGIALFSVGLAEGILVLMALAARQMGEDIPLVGVREAIITPLGILFVVLAIGTAYKVASGGSDE